MTEILPTLDAVAAIALRRGAEVTLSSVKPGEWTLTIGGRYVIQGNLARVMDACEACVRQDTTDPTIVPPALTDEHAGRVVADYGWDALDNYNDVRALAMQVAARREAKAGGR